MAIEMAKNNVVANLLILGYDVTTQKFEDAVVDCFRTYNKCNTSFRNVFKSL